MMAVHVRARLFTSQLSKCRLSIVLIIVLFYCPTTGQKEQDDILSSLYTYLDAINIRAIFPFLIEQSLITSNEKEYLMSPQYLDADKINQLLMWLPKKGSDALDRFIKCLEDSSDGTGHEMLAKKIRKAIYEEKISSSRKYISKYNSNID